MQFTCEKSSRQSQHFDGETSGVGKGHKGEDKGEERDGKVFQFPFLFSRCWYPRVWLSPFSFLPSPLSSCQIQLLESLPPPFFPTGLLCPAAGNCRCQQGQGRRRLRYNEEIMPCAEETFLGDPHNRGFSYVWSTGCTPILQRYAGPLFSQQKSLRAWAEERNKALRHACDINVRFCKWGGGRL